jgi:hypothetical protein
LWLARRDRRRTACRPRAEFGREPRHAGRE